MAKIFVSYRRQDSSGHAGRLFDRLHREFGAGEVFFDIDNLQPGDDFVDAIERTLDECDVVLVVIGPRWLMTGDAGDTPRLADEHDWVRMEIQTALERKIRTIPVLVERAKLPRREQLPEPLWPLLRRQAIELSDERWSYDVGKLIRSLTGVQSARPIPAADATPRAVELTTMRDREAHAVASPPRQPHPVTVTVSRRPIARAEGTLLPSSVVASRDMRRLAFFEKKGGFLGLGEKFYANIDGNSLGSYDDVLIPSAFSLDGSRHAFGACQLGQWFVVEVTKEGVRQHRMYDGIGAEGPIFGPNGRLAYSVKIRDRWSVIVDGRPGPIHDLPSGRRIAFSPDGRRFAYGACVNGKWMLVLDEVPGAAHDGFAAVDVVFSPDSRRLAYCVQDRDTWRVVVDDQLGAPHDGISKTGPVFSPDSRRLAYGATDAGRWAVVVDGQPGEYYDGIGDGLVFSADSQRLSYKVKRDGKWAIVVDGKPGKLHDIVALDPPVFSPDSRRLAYGCVDNGNWTMVVDGEPGEGVDNLGGGPPIFSSDSRRLAYAFQRHGAWQLRVDGQVGRPYQEITDDCLFTPDSAHVVYVAQRQADSTWVLVVDERETDLDGAIIAASHIVVDSARALHLITVKDDTFYLVQVTLG